MTPLIVLLTLSCAAATDLERRRLGSHISPWENQIFHRKRSWEIWEILEAMESFGTLKKESGVLKT